MPTQPKAVAKPTAHLSTLLKALDGARMLIVAECETCGAFGLSYWHGEGTVNEMWWGELPGADAWTLYELKQISGWEVEKILRDELKISMCPCFIDGGERG